MWHGRDGLPSTIEEKLDHHPDTASEEVDWLIIKNNYLQKVLVTIMLLWLLAAVLHIISLTRIYARYDDHWPKRMNNQGWYLLLIVLLVIT